MGVDLHQYNVVLLDYSFFTSQIPDELLNQIKLLCDDNYKGNTLLCSSETFWIVGNELRKLLSPHQKRICDSNCKCIRKEKITILSPPEYRSDIAAGIWGLLSLLSSNKTDDLSLLIITSDALLIQRMVLNQYHIDIYDLNSNKLLRESQYEEISKDYEFLESDDEEFPEPLDLDDELTVYLSNGQEVTLEDADLEGAEAKLYRWTEEPDLIAKIFFEEGINWEKVQNIRYLMETGEDKQLPWMQFPIDMLFWDKECTHPAGFLQKYVTQAVSLEQPIFIGNLSEVDLELEHPSETADLCLRLSRQILFLNILGIYISDYNLSNFAEKEKFKGNNVILWDVDSFCSRNYHPKRWANDLPLPHIIDDLDTNSNAECIERCTESCYAHVFRLLTLGCPVVEADSLEFFLNKDSADYIRRKFMSNDVWELMRQVFEKQDNNIPCLDALVFELSKMVESYIDESTTDVTYQHILDNENYTTELNEEESNKDRRPAHDGQSANMDRRPQQSNEDEDSEIETPEVKPQHKTEQKKNQDNTKKQNKREDKQYRNGYQTSSHKQTGESGEDNEAFNLPYSMRQNYRSLLIDVHPPIMADTASLTSEKVYVSKIAYEPITTDLEPYQRDEDYYDEESAEKLYRRNSRTLQHHRVLFIVTAFMLLCIVVFLMWDKIAVLLPQEMLQNPSKIIEWFKNLPSVVSQWFSDAVLPLFNRGN